MHKTGTETDTDCLMPYHFHVPQNIVIHLFFPTTGKRKKHLSLLAAQKQAPG